MSAWSPHLPLKVISCGLTAAFRVGGGVADFDLLYLSQVSSSWALRLPPPPQSLTQLQEWGWARTIASDQSPFSQGRSC